MAATSRPPWKRNMSPTIPTCTPSPSWDLSAACCSWAWPVWPSMACGGWRNAKVSSWTAHRLRIVHISWGLDIGGLEKLLVEFARWTERERFDLHFVSLGSRGQLANAITAHGWPVTALDEAEGVRPGLVLRLAGVLRNC